MGRINGLAVPQSSGGSLGSLAGGAGAGAITTTSSEYGLLNDYGIPDKFIKDIGSTIKQGTSAIFLLIRGADHDKLLVSFSRYEGTILNTSLSQAQEEKLRAALTHQQDQQTQL